MKAVQRATKWLFIIVPLVGIAELVAHAVQVRSVIPARDWAQARDVVRTLVRSDDEDLIAIAPRWLDPLARTYFGDDLLSIKRLGRAEESRFKRVIEVSARGKRLDAFAGWRKTDERKAGAFTIRVLDNPTPVHVIDDLVTRAKPNDLSVFRVDGASRPCDYVEAAPQMGALGYGMAIPGHRYACPSGGFVGESVLPSYPDYFPRRVLYAQPPGGNDTLELRFSAVRMGHALRGHHGVAVHHERDGLGPGVVLGFRIGERLIGTATHRDTDGWKAFEFQTPDLAGQSVDLTVTVACKTGGRPYGFEAVTVQ